jgi:MraZ protein
MFRGTISTKVDSKGRLLLGTKNKDELGDKAIVVRGEGPYLKVFPLGQYEELEKRLRAATDLSTEMGLRMFFDAKFQNYVTNFFSNQAEVDVDEQGRIVIPKFLCEQIGLVSEAIVRAAGNHLQIWTLKDHHRRPDDETTLDAKGFLEYISSKGDVTAGGGK